MTKTAGRSSIRGFFDAVAIGSKPTTADIAAEGVPESAHGAIRQQVRDIHALTAEGRMQEARNLARDLAHDWERRLGEDVETERLDPRALADQVDPYGFGGGRSSSKVYR